MKGVISRAVVAAALMTTFSAQALVSNTTKLANANSGVVAAQVNWFDFTGFNRTEAISAAGQAFTQTLPDGSVLKFTAKVSGPSTDVAAVVQRYWSASFYGTTTALLPDHANGFYTGVTGNPQVRTAGGNATLTLSDISYTAPGGATLPFQIVAVDAETTGKEESIAFTSSGSAWQTIDSYLPANSSTILALNGSTATVSRNPVSQNTVAGIYLLASNNPTSVAAEMTLRASGPGAEGVAFGVVPLPPQAVVPLPPQAVPVGGAGFILMASGLVGLLAFGARKQRKR